MLLVVRGSYVNISIVYMRLIIGDMSGIAFFLQKCKDSNLTLGTINEDKDSALFMNGTINK